MNQALSESALRLYGWEMLHCLTANVENELDVVDICVWNLEPIPGDNTVPPFHWQLFLARTMIVQSVRGVKRDNQPPHVAIGLLARKCVTLVALALYKRTFSRPLLVQDNEESLLVGISSITSCLVFILCATTESGNLHAWIAQALTGRLLESTFCLFNWQNLDFPPDYRDDLDAVESLVHQTLDHVITCLKDGSHAVHKETRKSFASIMCHHSLEVLKDERGLPGAHTIVIRLLKLRRVFIFDA
jgi:hypothetical protein